MKCSAENDFERNLSKLGISAAVLASMHIDDVRRDLEAVKAKGQVEEREKNLLSTAVSEALGKLTFLRSRVSEVDARKKAGASSSMCLLGKPECHAELMNRIDVELEQVIGQGKAARQAHDEAEAALKAQAERVENLSKEAYRLSDVMMALTSMMSAQARSVALDNIDKEIAVLTAQVRDNANTLEDVRAKELEISGFKMRRERLQGHVDGLLQELGKLNEVLARAERLRKEVEGLAGAMNAAKRENAIYSILAKAFSKEGIPALMIENIVPVLEADANAMLERLSDGRIRLQFLLQRKLKGGGMAESFEIYVTDENGTRSVQMYSGGEKYRIIFAVHSAFSKYLTYRGGSRIGFLAIDEPAGLDEAGISRLVETLSVLKEHYEQIFVITHLKELMEYFPQTIVVEKSGGSSKVTTKAKKTFSEGIL
jgi:exonuclease SbcC